MLLIWFQCVTFVVLFDVILTEIHCVISLQDHEFIPTRMKTIQASRPVANPQQYTRVPSNPLLVSAQRQMELAEEVKRQKEMARRNSERDGDSNTHFNSLVIMRN